MSYRSSYTDWFGDRKYETIETPDEDYDRMKQQELDEAVAAQQKETNDRDS